MADDRDTFRVPQEIVDQTGEGQQRPPLSPAEVEGAPVPEQTPVPEVKKSRIDTLDKEKLGRYINELLNNDRNDKENFKWQDKISYDVKAYYGLKKALSFPWINASNFPVPLTPTLLDTAHSNAMGSIFFDPEDTVDANAVGVENIRNEKLIENLMNWQNYNENDAYKVMDKAIFRAFLHGTGIVKIIQTANNKGVKFESIPIENVYLPLNAKGFQVEDTDHVFQVVALTKNDVEDRKRLKKQDGSPLFDGIEDIPTGFSIKLSSVAESQVATRDTIAGTKLQDMTRRDLIYIVECYLTYYEKDDNGELVGEPLELIAWTAPSTAKVMHVVENTIGMGQGETESPKVRPFAELIPYPRDDRFWGMSLPEKIRFVQEELDYAHNQNINAADISIMPPVFYREGSDFNPELNKRAPGGMYPVPEPKDISYPPMPVNPIFERQEDRYWDLAERLTGLTELFQGRPALGRQTATLTMKRENRMEIRFKSVYQRLEFGWSKLMSLMYLLDKTYMPKDKKTKILGVADYKHIEELFPVGIEGKYKFKFKGIPITEREKKKQDNLQLANILLTQPLAMLDKGNAWRVLKLVSESLNEPNLETIVTKPREASIISAEEAIQRIMSGDIDFVPDPAIDAISYIQKIQFFMRTDTFQTVDQRTQQAFLILLKRVQNIMIGQLKAKQDLATKRNFEGQAATPENGSGNQQPARQTIPQRGTIP